MNIALSEKLIHQLVHFYSIRTFCLCPGGRNAPLVSVLAQAKGLEVLSFFDERSAGFFALGRIRRDKKPVVVVTTSGTAVAELLPSVIEAWYSSLPVVLLTADRPSSYRLTGAPQSIEQKGIFGPYVGQAYDLENTLNFDLSDWNGVTPCHINVCFDEPLLDGVSRPLYFRGQHNKKQNPSTTEKKNLLDCFHSPKAMEESICSFFKKAKKPLCILAEIPEDFQSKWENILSGFNFPIYAEALSGLRESKKLFVLKSGEGILKWMAQNKKVDSVLRIGRRPVARFWQDLEKSYAHLPVLSVSDQPYSGLSRAGPALSFKAFFDWFTKKNQKNLFFTEREKTQINQTGFEKGATLEFFSSYTEEIKPENSNKISITKEDNKHYALLLHLLEQYPLSEPALIRDFSQKIPEGALLFLGNSLPIREWNELASRSRKKIKYMGNRGANGIDGQISTFLGACEEKRSNWCLTGDLSTLYDLSALWAFGQLRKKPSCFIVVVNNRGGRIFSSLFANPLFINAHNISFQNWAKMWHFHYYFLTQWPDKLSFRSPAVIELKVNPAHTTSFWQKAKTDKA